MPRARRLDRPHALHHVTNAGHAHRVLFDGQADVDAFFRFLRQACERTGIEVHAHVVMTTHFHLVVGSAEGSVAQGLQWAEDLYARYFNRTRQREGHVFKGRYFSRLIEDPVHLCATVAYIDRNPVGAGLVDAPGAYPHGSARYYLQGGGPPWLRRDLVEALACRVHGSEEYTPRCYEALLRAWERPQALEMVEQGLRSSRAGVAPIARLMKAGPVHVQRWLLAMTRAEEPDVASRLALSATSVDWAMREHGPHYFLDLGSHSAEAERLRRALHAGLLHSLCGTTMQQIAGRHRVSRSTVSGDLDHYRAKLRGDERYREQVASLVAAALERAYPGLARLGGLTLEPTLMSPAPRQRPSSSVPQNTSLANGGRR